MSRYRLTPEAARDLDDLTDYLAAKDPDAAARVVDVIQRTCQALAEMPGMGRSREEFGPGLRGSIAGRYVIFHRPDDAGIQVIRVVHGARDLPKLFE